MIQAKEKIDEKKSIVCFINDKTTEKDIKNISKITAQLFKLYKKEKKIQKKAVTVIQTDPNPTAATIAFIHLDSTQKEPTLFRSLAAKTIRKLSDTTTVQWVNFTKTENWEHHLSQVIEMVNYKMNTYKSEKKPSKKTINIIISSEKKAIKSGSIVGQAVNKARAFANEPANKLTTTEFVKQIKTLLKSDKRFSIKVLSEKDLEKQKMHALLGVGQGSEYPSYLVDITYKGSTNKSIALVGKGVMFDTGGISIKPSKSMKEMKGDMGGAAAVVAAAWATGQLNIKKNVSFIIPIVENMVSKSAQRPGDVVVASNGTSIEITNTDAEGRLILADALVYAAKKKVSAIIDIATLTGASIIALGPYAISVLSNNQSLVDNLIKSANNYHERCWQLPLFDDYKELIKSDIADVINANETREAGVITAAKFLECFVNKTPWIHMDIASTMLSSSNKNDQVKGMTGSGTRSLISFIENSSSW